MTTCLIQNAYVRKTGFLIASDHLGVAEPIVLATKATSQYKNIINEILPCVSATRIALQNIR
ncbi:hypothetical protein ECV0102_06400 [Enterobacter cloacae]|nr:hypothetical protein ECV0102_06400 [Enterobacter cloacae]